MTAYLLIEDEVWGKEEHLCICVFVGPPAECEGGQTHPWVLDQSDLVLNGQRAEPWWRKQAGGKHTNTKTTTRWEARRGEFSLIWEIMRTPGSRPITCPGNQWSMKEKEKKKFKDNEEKVWEYAYKCVYFCANVGYWMKAQECTLCACKYIFWHTRKGKSLCVWESVCVCVRSIYRPVFVRTR